MDVAARARIQGILPWQAIADETRPVDSNQAFHDLGEFFRQESANFLAGYWRDLLQSQPHHVEIVAEKLTVRSILARVAREHTMPMTISRGMCSLPAKRKIYERYVCSQKEKLILLCVSDLDPAGDTIAADLPEIVSSRTLAWTMSKLSKSRSQSSKSSNMDSLHQWRRRPRARHIRPSSNDTASPMPTSSRRWSRRISRRILTHAIHEVIDVDLFNQELGAEQADAAKLVAIQERCAAFFKSFRGPEAK